MKNSKLKKVVMYALVLGAVLGSLIMPLKPIKSYASNSIQLKDLPIGSVVYDPSWEWEHRIGNGYSGSGEIKPVEWLIVAHNHYEGMESHATLLSNELIGKQLFDNSTNRGSSNGSNHWGESGTGNASMGIRKWLNGSSYNGEDSNYYNLTFYDSFSDNFKNSILETTLNMKTHENDNYTVIDNVFLPSQNELGGSYGSIGTDWGYFTSDSSRIAKLNNIAVYYWTCSPSSSYSSNVWRVNSGGSINSGSAHNTYGVRPALNLKSDIIVCTNPENWQEGQLVLGELPENYHLLDEAIEAVEIAEDTKIQEDVDNARNLVNELPDGEVKDNLNARLDAVQVIIDNLDDLIARAIQAVIDAEEAVIQAEYLKTMESVIYAQEKIDYAWSLVLQLPDGLTKTELINRLTPAETTAGEAETIAQDIVTKVNNVINNPTEENIVVARTIVDTMPNSDKKAEYLKTINTKHVDYVTINPSSSEYTIVREYIGSMPEETDVQRNYKKVTRYYLADKETSYLPSYIKKRVFIDKTGSGRSYYTVVRDYVYDLPEDETKTTLIKRVEYIGDVLDINDDIEVIKTVIDNKPITEYTKVDVEDITNQIEDINTRMVDLEEGDLKQQLINKLIELQNRLDKVLAYINAREAVELAEDLRTLESVEDAFILVNKLDPSPDKTDLVNRLNAILDELEGDEDTAPTLIIEGNPSGWTNQDIELTIKAVKTKGSGIEKIIMPDNSEVYPEDEEDVLELTTNYFVSVEDPIHVLNEEYTFIAKDKAGNTAEKTITVKIDKVDPTKPLVSYSPIELTSEDVTITIEHGTDLDSGVNKTEYKIDDGNWVTYTNSFTVDSNCTIYARTVDNAGNISTEDLVEIDNIDKEPLVITINPYETNWTNEDIMVTAEVNKGSLNETSYTFTENGSFTFIATDDLENTISKTVTITNIDKTDPELTLTLNPDDISELVEQIDITVKAVDSGSGIKKIILPNNKTVAPKGLNNSELTAQFAVIRNGSYEFKVEDNAGNVTAETVEITNIDETLPVIVIEPYETEWTNKNITVKAAVSKGNLNKMFHTFTQNGSFEFIAVDKLGNEVKKLVEIDNIDKILPEIDLVISTEEPTNQNVIVTITATDDLSGIKKVELPVSEDLPEEENTLDFVAEYEITKNGFYTFKAVDNAGNTASKTVNITNINKTKPIVTIQPYNTKWTNNDITVTAKTNRGTLNQTSYTFTKNGSFEFIAVDEFGNETKKVVEIDNIDKVLPSLTLTANTKEPTPEDVIITVKATDNLSGIKEIILPKGKAVPTEKGSLEFTAEYFINANGIYEFKAVDNAGNIVFETIEVTNIDKVPPVITIEPYETDWTKDNVTINATADKGTLNKTSHTFTKNGSFEFVVTYGSLTAKRTVSIANIDKTPPSKPVVIRNEHELALTKSIDNESGIDRHEYCINDGDWTEWDGNIRLYSFEDGEYTITVRAFDKVGNESELSSTDFIIDYEEKKDEMEDIFENLDPEVIGEDIIKELPEEIQAEYRERLRKLKEALMFLELAESLKLEVYITSAENKIAEIDDGLPEKSKLEERLEAVINGTMDKEEKVKVKNATVAVELAEKLKMATYINKAMAEVEALKDGLAKTELLNRLNALK